MSFYPTNQWAGQVQDCLQLTEGVVTQRPGAAVQITATTAGSVILTLVSEATIVVNPALGDSIYPYEVIKFVPGTAVISAAYNLFT